MRRAVPGLLSTLLLVACGPTKEQEVTKQVLVSAHTARTGALHITMRYGEILASAGRAVDAPVTGWEDVAAFRESAEGRVARELLSEYARPVPVDPAFARARDIEAVSVATAELVKLALEPRGTRESFAKEMEASRSRLDRAVSALETGTKSFVLIEARTETNRKSSVYAEAIARARAADASKTGGASPAPRDPS